MARMVRKQIYLEVRQDLLLKERAETTGLTESELIRAAIDSLYDAADERRRHDLLWGQWEAGIDALGPEIERAGGLGRFKREHAHERHGRAKT